MEPHHGGHGDDETEEEGDMDQHVELEDFFKL